MVLDLISEINSDFYPMYFYITIILTIFCSLQLVHITHHYLNDYRSITTKNQKFINITAQLNRVNVNSKSDRLSWITKKMKRKEGPEDDSDNNSSNLNKTYLTIRGGLTCLNKLYSLFSKNIAL
ncbi:hypothetical protein [Aquibacillus kalidii]|uniref:hypothetical protein n=1 Tax=Aquibacillus kalidii TaxID=2762597 RepID=UPI0016443647|nr:hypothetical protein [Aquibacillus kalidii]